MQLLDGGMVLSATDLVGYLACDHLATLELGRVAGLWQRPHRRDDPTIEIIQAKGDLHEADYLARLRADGLTVVEIDKGDLRTRAALEAAAADTLAAMRAGADVVYQATFFDGRWRGHADFLFKRADRPSPALGAWSYDVADTKLARAVKAGAVLQLCVYAAQLEAVQGIAPEFLHVVTGDRTRRTLRTDEFAAYFRYVRARFEARIGRDGANPAAAATYPDPVDHCRVCAWSPTCIQRRRDDDHLSIVAGMRRVDTERLVEADIDTLTALATIEPATDVEGIPAQIVARLHHQARLQLHERRTRQRVYELIEPDGAAGRRGLGMLPEPSPWDVFFDIEADPWATDDGLEYLLGVTTVDTGEPVYRPIWGTDRVGEGAALAEFLRFVDERLDAHPDLHVYHYGGYEPGAIKRLIARHGRGDGTLDRLLRGDVLVDLLNVVRQGIRASVESYSLKQIEKFYMPVRSGPVTEAGFSVVEFERWMRERDAAILDGIAAYNRDDCESTWRLRDWLEARRTEAIDRWTDLDWSRPVPRDPEPSAGVAAWEAQLAPRIAGLTASLDPADTSEEAMARRLLADLLDWHRREEKQQWWRWFELRDDLTVEDLVAERDALGGLEFESDLPPDGRRLVRRYRFEPQDHPFKPGDKPLDKDTGGTAGEVVALDDARGTIDLARSATSAWSHPRALIGPSPIDSRAMKSAMLRVADDVIEHGFAANARYPAVGQLLLRRPPRIAGHDGGPLRHQGEDIVDAARRLGLGLDRSVLPIQGPPGTGKTYTAARMITELVRHERTVGVMAQSHKTITNLLEEVVRAGAMEGTRVTIAQKAGDLDAHLEPGGDITVSDDPKVVEDAARRGEARVVAGTVWLHARNQLDAVANGEEAPWIDVLFVDEAGQMSLANLVAAATVARSIVLVGDPNQLPMVSQGSHPPGAEASSLQHLVGGSVTVEPERGLFLEVTRRLHPDVNAFISDAFYADRLRTHPDTDRTIDGPADPLTGAGIRWWPTDHTGNAARSREEAARVADAVAGLIGREQVRADGSRRRLAIDDVLVVAAYNAQVAEIQAALIERLGTTGNVGTVDKFQGREGAVAIYSMASSSRDDAPRDMGFLYSRNRLNVAVSRAQSIAIVIASPRLLEAGCRTPEQMRLVDALCRFVEVAGTQAGKQAVEQAGRAPG